MGWDEDPGLRSFLAYRWAKLEVPVGAGELAIADGCVDRGDDLP